MPGAARADLLVRRVRRVATGVADRSRDHARLLPEILLGTPEAAECEERRLRTGGPGRDDRRPENGVTRVDGNGGGATRESRLRSGHGAGALQGEHGVSLRTACYHLMTAQCPAKPADPADPTASRAAPAAPATRAAGST